MDTNEMLRLWEARITVIAAQAAGWVARPYLMILGPRAGPDHRMASRGLPSFIPSYVPTVRPSAKAST